MNYQIKIDMDNKSLLDMLTYIKVQQYGVNLSEVYNDEDKFLAESQCEKLEEFGFKTKITTINQ